jgi:hypothetical protein
MSRNSFYRYIYIKKQNSMIVSLLIILKKGYEKDFLAEYIRVPRVQENQLYRGGGIAKSVQLCTVEYVCVGLIRNGVFNFSRNTIIASCWM